MARRWAVGLMSGLHPALQDIRGVALDLDGVLYDVDTPIPGAVRTVGVLRSAGMAVRFVTNTTSLSRGQIAQKLERLGFQADVSEVFCPARGAASWLLRQNASASFFVQDQALEDFDGVTRNDDRPDAVVIGDLGTDWTFESLNRAFRLVHERGARLVGLGRTRYWKGPRGLQLDVGPFVAALEQATGGTALVFGKPDPAFFAALLEDLGEPVHRVAIVGDDIVSDVGAAMAAGLVGVLVRTGKFRPRDLDGEVRPDLVLDSVGDLIDR